MSVVEFKVKIENGMMFVRKMNMCPSVFLVHAKALENVTAKYPICRVVKIIGRWGGTHLFP